MKRYLLALLGLWALAASAGHWPRMPPGGADAASRKTRAVKREEVVVVSGLEDRDDAHQRSRHHLGVVAPTPSTRAPAQNYGDLLRSVPGLNVIQTSARDINIDVPPGGTSTLVNSQLVLLDGRSLYLDFFGLVLWDFLPQSPSEIKQIEVVRGPASVGVGSQRPDRGGEHHHQDAAGHPRASA